MSKPTLDSVVTNYKDTGNCEIDCDVVVKLWSGLWFLSQWKNEFRLVKYKRKDSPTTAIKVSISEFQAKDLINRLELVETQCNTFRFAVSWRKDN